MIVKATCSLLHSAVCEDRSQLQGNEVSHDGCRKTITATITAVQPRIRWYLNSGTYESLLMVKLKQHFTSLKLSSPPGAGVGRP
jgi:hypothetical protein